MKINKRGVLGILFSMMVSVFIISIFMLLLYFAGFKINFERLDLFKEEEEDNTFETYITSDFHIENVNDCLISYTNNTSIYYKDKIRFERCYDLYALGGCYKFKKKDRCEEFYNTKPTMYVRTDNIEFQQEDQFSCCLKDIEYIGGDYYEISEKTKCKIMKGTRFEDVFYLISSNTTAIGCGVYIYIREDEELRKHIPYKTFQEFTTENKELILEVEK